MNVIVAVAALLAAFDLPERFAQFRAWPVTARAAAGAATVAGAVILAVIADPLLDALDISAPTMQIGASMVLAVWSVWMFFTWDDRPAPTRRDRVAGPVDGVMPGAFPILVNAAVATVAVAVSGRNGVIVPGLVAVAVGGSLTIDTVVRGGARRTLRRLSATVGIVTAVAMMSDGVFAM